MRGIVDGSFGAGGVDGCEGDVTWDMGGFEGVCESWEEQCSEDRGAHGLCPGRYGVGLVA